MTIRFNQYPKTIIGLVSYVILSGIIRMIVAPSSIIALRILLLIIFSVLLLMSFIPNLNNSFRTHEQIKYLISHSILSIMTIIFINMANYNMIRYFDNFSSMLKFDIPQIFAWFALIDGIISICIIEPVIRGYQLIYWINIRCYTQEQIEQKEITTYGKNYGSLLGFTSLLSITYSFYSIGNLLKLDLNTYDQVFTWLVVILQGIIFWSLISWVNIAQPRLLCCSARYWNGAFKCIMVPGTILVYGLAIIYNTKIFTNIISLSSTDCEIYQSHETMCVTAHLTILLGFGYLLIGLITLFIKLINKCKIHTQTIPEMAGYSLLPVHVEHN